MKLHPAVAAVPFVLIIPVLVAIPLPPATMAPIPVGHASLHAIILLGLLTAHTWCYARWQPAAPRRILLNELLARAWFVGYWLLIIQGHTSSGLGFLAMAAPWAVLTWEVHRQEVRKNGYQVAWNLTNWGLFMLGLALLGFLAFQF